MTTKKSNFPTKDRLEKQMQPLIEKGFDEFIFRPTAKQRLAKARLLTALQAQPLIKIEELPRRKVEQIVGINLSKDWSKEGFQAWLFNRSEYEEKLEVLFSLALDAAEQILQNGDPKAQSARVQMVKIIAELANKTPNKWKQQDPIKDAIDGMSKDEIEDLLGKHGLQLKITAKHEKEPINVTPESVLD